MAGKKKGRFSQMFSLGFRQLNDPYYQGFAAQVSFYFMLSLVPMILLISQILGYVLGTTINEAVGWILSNAEGTLATTLKNLFTYKSGGFTNIIYVLIALWAASRAQFSMMRINNFINTEGISTGKGYWRERFRAVVNMVGMLLTIVAALVLLSFGGKIINLITHKAGLWIILRWPLALLLFFLVVSVYYYTLPEKKVKFKEIIPGSIFASIGLLAVTYIYSKYTSSVADYDIVYGSLATIVALMFWFYFLSWVFCLGMLFNKVWKDTNDDGE